MRIRTLSLLTSTVAAMALAAPAHGQAGSGSARNNAGVGGIYGPVDPGGGASKTWIELDPVTGNNGHLGVCVVNTGTPAQPSYEILVSSRGLGAVPPHLVYRFDVSGNLLGSFNVDGIHNGPAANQWGMRDLVADPSGGGVFAGGSDGGITIQDTTGALVSSFNGTPVVNPITGAGLARIGNYRALAYDPHNNSFWTANFGSELIEIDFAGNILTTISNSGGWSIFGAAYDQGNDGTTSKRLYVNSIPDLGPLGVIDLLTGAVETGSVPNLRDGAQGGLSPAPAGGVFEPWDAGFLVATLQQGNLNPTDVVGIQRIDYLTNGTGAVTKRGVDEVFLESEVNSLGFDRTAKSYATGDTIAVRMTDPLGANSPIAAMLFNIDVGDTDATTNLGVGLVPEARAFSAFSMPAIAFPIVSLPVGTSTGAINVVWPVTAMNDIRVQGVHLELLAPPVPFPFQLTNEIHLKGNPTASDGVLCEAAGSNSFNAVTSSGYWRISYLSDNWMAGNITGVQIDLGPIPGLEFDTNEINMADTFEGGNSASVGCLGTYRNGSEGANGLVYAGTNVPGCDAGAFSGWIGSNPAAATPGNYRTIDFAFTTFAAAGPTFEFDADTDGGPGFSGGNMAGAVFTITFADGSVRSGALALDLLDPNRSFVNIL